jgi:hypothetical protein
MRRILIIIVLLSSNYFVHAQVPDTLGKDSFLPKLYNQDKRIFLLFSPSNQDERYEKQMNILLENRDVLTRAGVALYKLFPEEGLTPLNKRLVTANVLKLRQQFNIEEDDFALMYVTVNGAVQMREEEVVGIKSLLTVIDTTTYYRPEFEFDY